MIEYRIKTLEERLHVQEQGVEKKLVKLEERLKQVNQKFDRIEQLGDRLESLNNLFDQLKANFDAKLQVFDEKLTIISGRIGKLKIDDAHQLYLLVKKSFKDVTQSFQRIKAQDYKPSEADLQASNLTDLKNDRLRSITQEKTQTDDEVNKKVKFQIVDKFQFTLKTKPDEGSVLNVSNKNISNKKLETTLQGSCFFDKNTSNDQNQSKIKNITSTNFLREQLKNLRK